MSITSFREMLEGKGCRIILGLIMLALILGMVIPSMGMFGLGNQNGQQQAATGATNGVVAKLGSTEINETFIQSMVDRNKGSMGGGQDPNQFPVALQSQFFYAPAVDQSIQGIAMLEVAKKLGIKMDDAKMETIVFDQAIQQTKDQMVQAGQLKANATEADFAAAVKKQGSDLEKGKAELKKQISTMIKDPAQRLLIEFQVANKLIGEHFQAQIAASDAELKLRYTTYNGKRIVLDKNKNTKEDLEKIRQEILDKKITFEAAMDKHTTEPPAKDKKAHDNVFQLSGDTAMVDPSYAEIPKLKPGDVSNVMSLPEGFVIMRFDGTSSDMPKDFAKNRANYVKQYKELISARKMMDEREAILKDPKVLTWYDKSFEAMYQWMQFQQDPEARKLDLSARRAKLEEFFKMAVEGSKSANPASRKFGALAAVGLLGALAEGATPEQTTELDDRRIELYATILEDTEDANMRLELAMAHAKKNDPEGVATSLTQAVRSNFDYENGAALNARISSMLGDFEKKKQITPEGAKAVRDAQRDWVAQKEQHNKDKAQFEKEQKKMEADAAAAKKKEEAAAKAAGAAKAGQPK